MENKKPKVKDYMTRDVVTVSLDETVEDAIEKMDRGHSGVPVVSEDEKLRGFITANDLLGQDRDTVMEELMSTDLVVAEPEMEIDDAARVVLRSGIQKLPVVNKDGKIVGIISNSDVIRSQIERVTPRKVWGLKETFESIHDITVDEKRENVKIKNLKPTQLKIYADELEGRTYELKRGLAEPLIVIQRGDEFLLVDGHHRVVAAMRLDIDEMSAYILVVDEDVELGMEKTAKEAGLETLDDIEIVDYARHPLVEATRFEEE